MKKVFGLVVSLFAVFVMASSAMASEQKVEAYAHPTMFGSDAQETVYADASYIVGGKILKSNRQIGMKNKDNVLVDSWVKDILATIKENTGGKVFNPKMPVLRSELAVILAEGLNIKNGTPSYKYNDIPSNYWAKDWIDKALVARVMIGYPDKTFKPDQPVTKAEVFATIATLIQVPTDRSLNVPEFKGKQMKYIPKWAIAPTKEVVASQLLDSVPNPAKVADDEYLSKEQVAYLVGTLRQNYIYNAKNGTVQSKFAQYKPTCLTVKLTERLSARTSNVGDKFNAKLTKAVDLSGQSFAEGATVKGEVVEVARPGIKNPGYIKVKFLEIKDGDKCLKFPKNISEAQANEIQNPNFIARLLGAPFSVVGRIVGVAGRTVGGTVNVVSNGLEKYGDNWSNVFLNTLDMHPGAGLKSFGNSFITLGVGIFDIAKLVVSGTFGLFYELTDEIKYVIIPSTSNNSSLNPDEELTIIY